MTSLLPPYFTRGARQTRTTEGTAPEPNLETWQDAPHNRWAFAHVAEFVPTAPIAHQSADAPPRPVTGLSRLASVPGLVERLDQSYTDALVVVRDGAVVAEHYRDGVDPDGLHLLMSVSKSICGLTVGTLVDDGLLDTDRRVDDYVQ